VGVLKEDRGRKAYLGSGRHPTFCSYAAFRGPMSCRATSSSPIALLSAFRARIRRGPIPPRTPGGDTGPSTVWRP
jgi:hypothetical protein